MKMVKFKNIALVLFAVLLIKTPAYSYFYAKYKAGNNSNDYITVTGDSYAGWFASYEAHRDYNMYVYADAGKSTEENLKVMEDAIDSESNVILISIGVNDHNKRIPLDEFKYRMSYLIETCALKNKKVLLHTYMDYILPDIAGTVVSTNVSTATGSNLRVADNLRPQYKVTDYDDELRELGRKYKNAFYIDMSDYNYGLFLQDDKIHYNKLFYDALYERVKMAIMLL